MSKTSKLNSILMTLQEVESVEHIRISAKICSFNPYRILDDPGLLKMFRERCQARLGSTIWIGNHFSNPKEFTDSSREAVRLLRATGVGMLNNVPIVRGNQRGPGHPGRGLQRSLQNGHFELLRLGDQTRGQGANSFCNHFIRSTRFVSGVWMKR